jgi:hypothetical protein
VNPVAIADWGNSSRARRGASGARVRSRPKQASRTASGGASAQQIGGQITRSTLSPTNRAANRAANRPTRPPASRPKSSAAKRAVVAVCLFALALLGVTRFVEWAPDGAASDEQAWPEDTYLEMEPLTLKEWLATRDNESAEVTILQTGDHVAGIDFEPGRYVIEPVDAEASAWIVVKPYWLSPGPLGWAGIVGWVNWTQTNDVATLTLPRTCTIEVADASIRLTPAEPLEGGPDQLGLGEWTVGVDIEPGLYRITAPYGTISFFTVGRDPREDEGYFERKTSSTFLDYRGVDDPASADVTLLDGESLVLYSADFLIQRLDDAV